MRFYSLSVALLLKLVGHIGTHTGTERPYLKTYFRSKLEETLNEVRLEEKLDDEPYEVVMSEHEEEVIQYV